MSGRTPLQRRRLLAAAASAIVLVAFGVAQEREGHGYGGRTIAHDGWYAEEQADRGAEAYARHCARCHHVELDGAIGVAPPLAGPEFLARWEGASVARLFHYTRSLMPLDAPGTLPDATYLDILAHVLRENGLPAGNTPLRPSADQLSRLVLEGAAEDADVPAREEEGEAPQPR